MLETVSLFLFILVRPPIRTTLRKLFNHIGPGTLVAAAFIGPGTVTVCSLAGVEFGFTLLWALLLSIVATIVLQEMAARLGLVSGKGLAEVVRVEISNPFLRFVSLLLVVSAILIGNAAYEAGNITGGSLGLRTIVPNSVIELGALAVDTLSLLIALLAFVLLIIGSYKLIERILVLLVLFMSISFLLTAFLTQPDWVAVLYGLFVPSLPEEGLITVLALIGTTVVPYNLFLHASLVREKWEGEQQLRAARKDTYVSVALGGLVSVAIVICGAAIESSQINSAAGLALGLEPLYGRFSEVVISLGLFAAGITSAITAPMAAAYVAQGCFGWRGGIRSRRFRMTWMLVLLLGLVSSFIGGSPIEIIRLAQFANALLLPIIAVFLLWAVNQKRILGQRVNSRVNNLLASLIVLITFLLGLKSLSILFNFDLFN
jgi:Mn2+/Fe2+ NRAMP family transporter